MTEIKEHSYRITAVSFGVCYLLSQFFPVMPFFILTALLLTFLVCQTLPKVEGVYRYISPILFLLGGFLLIKSGGGWTVWVDAISSNCGLVAFFVFLPFFNFLFYYDEYEGALKNLSHVYIKNSFLFSVYYSALTFFLSSLLNVGAFPVIYNLYKRSGVFENSEKALSRSISRGLIAANLWSPNFMSVAVILHYLDLQWIKIAPAGLFLAFLVLVSHCTEEWIKNRGVKEAFTQHSEPRLSKSDRQKIISLARVLFYLIAIIALLNIATKLSILVIIPLVGILYPLLVAGAAGKMALYKILLRKYYDADLSGIKNQLIIFAAAGILGRALEISKAGEYFTDLLRLDSLQYPVLAILVIILACGVLAQIGIHPIITISAISGALTHQMLGISKLSFALTLISSYGFACLVSPFSGTILVLAGLLHRSPWELSLRQHYSYYFCVVALFTVLLSFV